MFDYDINTNTDVLEDIKTKLILIRDNLQESVNVMQNTLNKSSEYLSGNQYEKAKDTNNKCLRATDNTIENIKRTVSYIEELQNVLEKYYKYIYTG